MYSKSSSERCFGNTRIWAITKQIGKFQDTISSKVAPKKQHNVIYFRVKLLHERLNRTHQDALELIPTGSFRPSLSSGKQQVVVTFPPAFMFFTGLGSLLVWGPPVPGSWCVCWDTICCLSRTGIVLYTGLKLRLDFRPSCLPTSIIRSHCICSQLTTTLPTSQRQAKLTHMKSHAVFSPPNHKVKWPASRHHNKNLCSSVANPPFRSTLKLFPVAALLRGVSRTIVYLIWCLHLVPSDTLNLHSAGTKSTYSTLDLQ